MDGFLHKRWCSLRGRLPDATGHSNLRSMPRHHSRHSCRHMAYLGVTAGHLIQLAVRVDPHVGAAPHVDWPCKFLLLTSGSCSSSRRIGIVAASAVKFPSNGSGITFSVGPSRCHGSHGARRSARSPRPLSVDRSDSAHLPGRVVISASAWWLRAVDCSVWQAVDLPRTPRTCGPSCPQVKPGGRIWTR
jgi:hypothetical protein